MPNTPRTQIPYPDENSNPFFDSFVAMINAIDASIYATRENRDIVIMNGGAVTWTASSGALTWAADIELYSSIVGYVWRIAGPGSVTLNDGDLVYLTLVRAPVANVVIPTHIGQRVPNVVRGDDQLLLAVRRGSRVYFRNGKVINDGDNLQLFTSTGSGGGGFTAGQDLSGTSSSQTVVGIRNVPVSASAPSAADQVLIYDGSQYRPTFITEDMIHPGFNITSFTGGSIVEVGQTITTPSFNASYSVSPDVTANSVVLTDDQSNPPKDVTGTPTVFSSNNNFTKNTFGATVTWTLTAKKGPITRTSTTTSNWWQKNYYGLGPAGQTSESFIESLTGFLSNTRATTFSVTAGGSDYIYYCFRSAYGTPTFFVGGFEGGFSLIGTTSVTNAHGFTENYDVYQSTNVGLGSTTVQVT